MKKMNNKGFSMVELIIVIAIMAILAGALAPTLIKYVNKSRKSSDVSNAQQVASAFQTAYSDPSSNASLSSLSSAVYSVNTLKSVAGGFGSNFAEVIGSFDGSVKYTKDGASCIVVDYNPTTNKIIVKTAGTGNGAGKVLYPNVDPDYE